MRVAIVNETIPYPANAGNRTRTLNLMCRLAQQHEVTYICRAAECPEETDAAVKHLKQHGIRTIIADAAPARKSGVGFYGRLAANVFSRLPYAVASHHSHALRARIRSLAQRGEIDLWQFEWLAYADAVADIPGVRTLVMAHNVESLIWKRYYQTEKSLLKRSYLREQWRKFERFERHIFRQVSGIVCVSEEDARLALADLSPKRIWVVANGIDREYFQQASADRHPHTILFLGSLEWRPNLDAVKLLLEQIFPIVLRAIPSARLCIVGKNPPEWLKHAVTRSPNTVLHGNVPDVRTYLASSTVMAVPLRVGGGSRLKILEAMACGLPVVSTPVGCEGLLLTEGREISIAETPEAIAESLVWAVRHPREALLMAEAGRHLVYQKYEWNALAQKLGAAWEQITRVQTSRDQWTLSAEVVPAMG